MLSREEKYSWLPSEWTFCIEEDGKWERIKDNDKNYYYIVDGALIQQPRGYYCRECAQTQWRSEYGMTFDDGSPSKFWTQCKDCKLASARSYAARKWTNVIKNIDPELNHTRLATFTIPNVEWDLKELGTNWEFHDHDFVFMKWVKENCRFTKDKRFKYLGEIPYLVEQASNAMRDKLKLRLKNMRHKHKRFSKNVLGGIVCYEATINIDVKNRKMSLHPHLHAILHGRYYQQSDLQEDWGLGICHIRKIENQWIAQLEVAKYVGKDGSRRTAWGSLRKERSKMLSELKVSQNEKHSKNHHQA
ncbi:MAG: replication protein [Circular genetic element sp.]|nr:MAG: replication protein [Circular genetic element sp.]